MQENRDVRADVQIDIPEIRAALRQIVADVIGADAAEVDEDVPLLDIVTSSLALVEGLRRLYDRFGVLVSIRRIVEAQAGIGALALYVAQAVQAQQTSAAADDEAEGRVGRPRERGAVRAVPLVASQQHAAFLTRYSPGAAAAQNETLAVRLRGRLDGPALQAAVLAIGNRYEALRTALALDADGLEITLDDRVELRVSRCGAEDLDRRLTAIAGHPFEPGERLFRAELLRVSDTEHVLMLVGHALVLDGAALAIVLEDLAEVYRTASRGGAVDLFAVASGGNEDVDPLGVQWTTHVARRETGLVEDGAVARRDAESYWLRLFADGVPKLDLPSDRPRPPVKSYAGARLVEPIAGDLAARLHAWSNLVGSTPESVLFGAFTVLLHRLARQDEIVVGAGGRAADLEPGRRVVAATETMLPVWSRYEPRRSFVEHIRALDAALGAAREHRQVSLAELIQALKLPRDQSRSAIFSAAFRTAPPPAGASFGPLDVSTVAVAGARARYDLELSWQVDDDGARLGCEYSTELFSATTVTRWLHGLLELLRAGIERPTDPCGLLPIMSPDELQTILANFPIWRPNDERYPHDRTALDLIVERDRARGDRPAIRFGDDTLTYQQLVERVEQIAGRLHERGIAPGDRVGTLLPRSLDLIPALLAIWRVGAIYVPLDRAFPLQRLAYIVEDAAIETVVTSRPLEALAVRLPSTRPLFVEDAGQQAGAPLAGVPAAAASASASILYTSGSTGQPKGVEVRHRGLTNVLTATQRLVKFTAADSLLALTTPSFDISLVELLVPLISGGVVEVGEDGLVADGIALAARIESGKPSVVQATPSTWKAVMAAGWGGDRDLRIISTGERLPRALAEQLLPRCQAVWNLYGPTETTIFSSSYAVVTAPDEPMRIGRPLANTQLYILDELLQPVPIGAVGELYVGGDGLARGYWRRPELTNERFIASPFRPGERLYRTGDLARYRADGDVVCLDRVDDQVKVHGVRIELGEIEAALRALDGVRDAVVTAWTDPSGDTQLVAHVVTDTGHGDGADDAPDAAAIRARLRERLPDSMVPPHVLFSAAFPLSPNGKVDRAALPTPGADGGAARSRTVPPATPTERQLAEAWARVLNLSVDSIGRDDDFMDLGGHSLLMTPLLLEVRGLFHVTFTMRELYGASTLQKLAALIEGRRRERAGGSNGTADGRAGASDWGKQRMAFLLREAQLPSSIGPARGLIYRPRGEIRTVLLTGATGFIGGHILSQALRTTDVELVCLVRPKRGERARARLEGSLRGYDLWRDDEWWQQAWSRRVRVVEGDVTLPRLGLEDTIYESLARELDAIVHSAAHVNFIYPYEALRTPNVLGVHEIIRLAFHRRITPVHYLSTAAIWPMGAENTFYERDPLEHGEILNLGYDESKWVGERCLLYAAERGLPVTRYRPGEVGGDSETGRCVTDHFLLASIKGFLQLGAMPSLDMYLDIAPADYVAKSVVYLALQRNAIGEVFHLTNPERWHMRDALAFIRDLGYQFQERPFVEIRDEMVHHPDFANNALFPYQAMLMEMDDRSLQLPHYDCQRAQRALAGSGIACPAVGPELMGTYLHYLWRVGYLPTPESLAVGAGRRAS